jgi:sigma-B regulation protein RsbU (phosphoserine phosphatase)
MRESLAIGDAVLDVIYADNSRRTAHITESPFFIGRGETGNHLRLADLRVSRQSATIRRETGGYSLEDRGQQDGLFVNGKKVASHVLRDGDVITFGPADSCEVIFRLAPASTPALEISGRIASAFGSSASLGASSGSLNKLNLLLEATMLLHSQLPLDSVLAMMLDHAIAVTQADRGLLLEADSAGALRGRVARRSGGLPLQPESFVPSQTALRLAMEQQSSTITEDLALADMNLQAAQSIVAQQLRAVVVIPLYAMPHAPSAEGSALPNRGHFLGVVYLDSRRPAAFSKLDRQMLDALAAEAASVLDNARLVQRELERQLFEQELRIAREIQQALLPRDFREFPHLAVSGVNLPSLTASGDYFDIFPIGADRTAFLIADVSGKGLGAALLTVMLQGALLGLTVGATASGIFRNLNRFLCQHGDVDRYATVFFGVLEGDGRLEFINAGHPSPLLLRDGEVSQPFTEGSVPVGLILEAKYTAAHAQLLPGDTLVLFSDGVTEAQDTEEQTFGVSRLRDTLAGQYDAPLDQLQKMVLDSVGNFTRGAGQADDITLLLVRYRPASRPPVLPGRSQEPE